MRLAAGVLVPFLFAGCAHEITSEERLERDLQGPTSKDAPTASELRKISCEDTPADLAKARGENRPEADRLSAYMELYESLKKRVDTFDDAMTRNPDLRYKEGSAQLVNARDLCVQQREEVHTEFANYVRDLVEVPTVQEIKGGTTVTVARLDFGLLREAIESLNPDDKDTMLNRVGAAEKKVEQSQPQQTSTGRRRGR